MVDSPSASISSDALFTIQIVSAVSGFVIAASVILLRKWHPPIAYTTAFNISFWIGIQAVITHSGSAISVRLPNSSVGVQRNEPLVKFLVWAQFAMPLWFVFLNATIATDLVLSQLFRLSVSKLQAIHRWYVPLATSLAFVLAFPLLVYHSEYRPATNVFSVQFPSALSVTLYYILAFDLWIAAGIVYCFAAIGLVVSVIVIKLRKKRAAWNLQNQALVENGWVSPIPVNRDGTEHWHHSADMYAEDPKHGASRHNAKVLEHIDPRQAGTFTHSHSSELRQPAKLAKDEMQAATGSVLQSNTWAPKMYHQEGDSRHDINLDIALDSCQDKAPRGVALDKVLPRCSAQFKKEEYASGVTIIDAIEAVPGTGIRNTGTAEGGYVSESELLELPMSYLAGTSQECADRTGERRTGQPKLALEDMPTPRTLRNHPSTCCRYSTANISPFRIPTLALVRLLLYPLVPIISFTLMCAVRWVWFRSAMPSRWEALSSASGLLRAMEGFLCLVVFLLNPALSRSFREIRQRNTLVFT